MQGGERLSSEEVEAAYNSPDMDLARGLEFSAVSRAGKMEVTCSFRHAEIVAHLKEVRGGSKLSWRTAQQCRRREGHPWQSHAVVCFNGQRSVVAQPSQQATPHAHASLLINFAAAAYFPDTTPPLNQIAALELMHPDSGVLRLVYPKTELKRNLLKLGPKCKSRRCWSRA